MESEVGYKMGEFDVLFKGGKMYIDSFDGKTKDVGSIKKTADIEGGALQFEVTGWKSSPVWPFDKLYGIFKESYGE